MANANNRQKNILSFENQEERDQLSDEMISLRFLAQVQGIMDKGDKDNKKISKKELASRLGTSPSYVTQLFQGDRIINVRLLTKIKRALGVTIEIVCYPTPKPGLQLTAAAEIPQLSQGLVHSSSEALKGLVTFFNESHDFTSFQVIQTATFDTESTYSLDITNTYALEFNEE